MANEEHKKHAITGVEQLQEEMVGDFGLCNLLFFLLGHQQAAEEVGQHLKAALDAVPQEIKDATTKEQQASISSLQVLFGAANAYRSMGRT